MEQLVNQQDDVGKNVRIFLLRLLCHFSVSVLSESAPHFLLLCQVHELERTRRNLETEAQNLRVQTQELEEELSEAENSRLRLEVTLQALKAQFERELSTSEEKGEEKRRALSKQVERKERGNHRRCCRCSSVSKSLTPVLLPMPGEGAGDPAGGGAESALSGRVIKEAAGSRTSGSRGPGGDVIPWERGGCEAATEAAGKTGNFPAHKIRFPVLFIRLILKAAHILSQGQMKEVLRELDETKLARDEVIAQLKDSEKKIQTLEAEVLQFTEVRAFK